MFNNFVVVLASLLLDSYIEFEWYESSCSSSSTTMNTSLGLNFPTMATRFSRQIWETLNLNLLFSFFKDYCKALSTHATNVALSNSK
jgi:hypothetical protein